MSNFIPANDLDRAIVAVQRSKAGLPELYRQLAAGELWFLIPYHPEIEGELLELKNGSPLPFASLTDQQGEVVPLFSSEARLEEALDNGRVPARTYSVGSMPAVQVLEILGKVGLRAVINKSCATGQVLIPPNLMRDLADGSALAPMPLGERQHGKAKILNPADYPTDLIQPVFELLRLHRNFRAAWVFGGTEAKAQPEKGRSYQLLILMQPRDAVIFHDLSMVVAGLRPKVHELGVGLIDEKDLDSIKQLFRKAAPFYTAADYTRPPEVAV
jgi:hypothetical protein